MEKSLLKQTFNIGTDDNCTMSWLFRFVACKLPRSESSVPVGDCETENQTQVPFYKFQNTCELINSQEQAKTFITVKLCTLFYNIWKSCIYELLHI